jgi:hypothetical protein
MSLDKENIKTWYFEECIPISGSELSILQEKHSKCKADLEEYEKLKKRFG